MCCRTCTAWYADVFYQFLDMHWRGRRETRHNAGYDEVKYHT